MENILKEIYEKFKSLCSEEQLNTLDFYLNHFKNPDFHYKMLPLTDDGAHIMKSTINMGAFNLEVHTISKELIFMTQVDFKENYRFKSSFGYDVMTDYYFCEVYIYNKNATGESLSIRHIENSKLELLMTRADSHLKIDINTNFFLQKDKKNEFVNREIFSQLFKNYLYLEDIHNTLLVEHDLFTFDDDIVLGLNENAEILKKEINKKLKNKKGISFD